MVNRKHLSQNMAFGLFRLLSLSVVGILFAILGFIIYKGIGVIDWEFLTTAPTNGMTAGGILPAIVGTFCLMAGSALFAFPVGVMSGIYMNEYVPKGWVVRVIRMMTNNLSGIPSIVFGLFGMALFVNYMDFGDSILAGSLTLGLLSLPLVIRTTEEALKAIPDSMREGSRALGATKLQTIWHVILPMGIPNIITGLILALGRVSGETAHGNSCQQCSDYGCRSHLRRLQYVWWVVSGGGTAGDGGCLHRTCLLCLFRCILHSVRCIGEKGPFEN